MAIHTEDELGKALKNGENRIEIEGNLATKVIRIKATGFVAWLVALGAIGVAVLAVFVTAGTGGAGAPAGAVGLVAGTGPAITILGAGTAATAVAVAVATGGVGALRRLYSGYTIVEKGEKRVVLAKT